MKYPRTIGLDVEGKIYTLRIDKTHEGELHGYVYGAVPRGVCSPGKLFSDIIGRADDEIIKKARELLEERFVKPSPKP